MFLEESGSGVTQKCKTTVCFHQLVAVSIQSATFQDLLEQTVDWASVNTDSVNRENWQWVMEASAQAQPRNPNSKARSTCTVDLSNLLDLAVSTTCCYCRESGGTIDTEFKQRFKTALPPCANCVDKGKHSLCRGPLSWGGGGDTNELYAGSTMLPTWDSIRPKTIIVCFQFAVNSGHG